MKTELNKYKFMSDHYGVYCDEESWEVIDDSPPMRELVCKCKFKDQAENIVKKLNAYPKLVEELKTLVDRITRNGIIKQSLIKNGQGGTVDMFTSESIALLTELEEL